jgi:hypothetical protein
MKNNLILASVLAVAATALHAQNEPLKANIPFDFVVASRTLPAGEYRVDEIGHPGFVILKNADGKGNAIALATPLQSSGIQSQGKLVFHRYGDMYFLSQIWRPGTNSGSEFRETRREHELASTASTQKSTALVAVR